ncbi:MAG: nucleotidyltransferase [Bacilli bacterium]|nr:nucleotidyltransferase [Bacilli bacterium]
MDIIGIIAEYNPFHNGHIYHINKIKELFPNSIIILVLNGYFLERGEISIESIESKTKLALENNVDIIVKLPFIFGSNSADTFSNAAIELLNELKINKLVFGSESNDIVLLKDLAKKQLDNEYNCDIKKCLKEGLNYPTALNKALNTNINTPNDLLGISYIKTILKNNYNIEPITIKRTNDYHDKESNNEIISATNIREKIKNNIDISKYVPNTNYINKIDYDLYFKLLKYKIINEDNLNKYLTVDEGIENRLKKVINECKTLDELINKTKTKRYTYNRINRMFIHILIGLTKEDKNKVSNNEYIRLLGFTNNGKKYINTIKKDTNIPIVSNLKNINSIIKDYEIKEYNTYNLLSKENILEFELSNKIIKSNND